jgi:hypothetical protein
MGNTLAVILALILALVFFAFLSWLAYMVIYLPTAWLIKPSQLKMVRLILSPLIVILIAGIYFSSHRPTNDDTATIEDIGNGYQITLKGQRLFMAHDPVSLFMQETYLDSITLTIPRTNGIINSQEIKTVSDNTILGGLKIDNEKLKVDLYYKNADDKTKSPLSWNGDYNLKWKSNN